MPDSVGDLGLSHGIDGDGVASRSSRRDLVLEELGRLVLLEGVKSNAMGICDHELANVSGVQLHRHQAYCSGLGIVLWPEVGQLQGREPFPVQIICDNLAARGPQETPIQHGVRDHGGNDSRGVETRDSSSSIKIPYYDFVLGVETDQPVGAELQVGKGAWPRWHEELVDSALAKDLDTASPEFRLLGAHGDEGLDRFVCDAATNWPRLASGIARLSCCNMETCRHLI